MEANRQIAALLAASDPVTIGEWTFHADSLLLECSNDSVKLEPRVACLLYYLAENAGVPVSRAELTDHVWSGAVVGDEALTTAINKLRNAFGDDSHHPTVIKTIPKVGYQLIADVEFLPCADGAPKSEPKTGKKYALAGFAVIGLLFATSPLFLLERTELTRDSISRVHPAPELPDKPSIVVLPFINMGTDPSQEYFADGITEDLITDLSKIAGLFVIARNSSFAYKHKSVDVRQVARELGVSYVLKGSVRRSGDLVRINAQLINAISGGHIWADRYDGQLNDVFGLQDKVTSNIATVLSIRLTASDKERFTRNQTANAGAYDEYLKGWEQYRHFTRDSFRRAELHFRRALALDPNYSQAHAALALIYWEAALKRWHKNTSSTFAGWVKARRELEKSMSNPTSLTHSLMSSMSLYNRRYDDAIAEAQRAIALNANSPDGYLALANALIFSGKTQEAIEMANKAIRLDPNYAAPYLSSLGLAHFDSKNYGEAADILRRSITINPKDQTPYLILIAAYGQSGEEEKALAILDQVNQFYQREYGRDFSIDWIRGQFPYQDKLDREFFLQGLRKGGVPEF